MGAVVDYVSVESLDRAAQRLIQAELDLLEELSSGSAGDGER